MPQGRIEKGRLKPAFSLGHGDPDIRCDPAGAGLYTGMVSTHERVHRVVLHDRVRLPWRFFGRLTAAVQAGL
jgi:hypothetical protein